MPKFCVRVHGGMFEIDDAIDEDDAREQVVDLIEMDIDEEEDDEDDEEEEEEEA